MKDIALFEYDASQSAVIDPDHEKFDLSLPEVAVFAFVGDEVEKFAREYSADVAAEFYSITKTYQIYKVNYKGRDICLCAAPCGAASATQIMDWLIGYGVKTVISTGSCGVLRDIPENAFLIPERALREEGTSFHYLPPSRYIDLNENMVKIIEEHFLARGISCQKCTAWTTDGFFRETKKKVTARREEGCSVVEMECAALAACARFRGVSFGQFFFTADSLHAFDEYDERGWGMDAMRPALQIAMDIAAEIRTIGGKDVYS